MCFVIHTLHEYYDVFTSGNSKYEFITINLKKL